MEISGDKKNPTWAYVWNNKDKSDIRKTIILDIFEPVPRRINTGTCMTVHGNDIENYVDGQSYCVCYFNYYEIIKNPEYRPFETIEEYIEATKDRKDLRAISKINNSIRSVDEITIIPRDNTMLCRGKCSKDIFNNYVWLDDRSPVGVKK